MKLELILEEWKADVEINVHDLATESLKTPKLHHKYYKIYVQEKSLLEKLEWDLEALYKTKYVFVKDGPSKEDIDAGKEPVYNGVVLNDKVDVFINADKEYIDKSLAVGLQKAKVQTVKDILDELGKRQWQIRNAIDFLKWTSGN